MAAGDAAPKEWGARPQRRRLPTWWEWVNILVLTERKAWTDGQRTLMRSATRYQVVRGSVAALLIVGAAMAARPIVRSLHTQAEFQSMKMGADSLAVRHYAAQLARAAAELRVAPRLRLDRPRRVLRTDAALGMALPEAPVPGRRQGTRAGRPSRAPSLSARRPDVRKFQKIWIL